MHYQQYLDKTARRKVLPLVQRIIPRLQPGSSILDLGCGAGVEVETLARLGHKVTAVDREPASVELVRRRCHGLDVSVHKEQIENFSISENSFDLIIALHSLPFLPPHDFQRVVTSIERGVRPGGLIVMRLFGMKDDWARSKKVTPVDNGRQLFQRSGTFLEYQESEKDDFTAAGDEFKHWHNIDLVYQVAK